uniref:C-type lectin domain-containing protein n=1 Tax=Branchiostoma floridae TaxID=7739 RepID=C3Y9C5_BRAFL|eukprot:XP_002607171.1 hypothetical protein BRAFLDRAFT_68034 [Branchiostoma floridae]
MLIASCHVVIYKLMIKLGGTQSKCRSGSVDILFSDLEDEDMTRGGCTYCSDECRDDPDTNVYQFTDVNRMDNPRQASPQSQQGGQPPAEDADRVDCNAADLFENPMYAPDDRAEDTDRVDCKPACSFENPMYAAGTLRQDDRGEETNGKNSNTSEIHDDPGNDVYHCINDDEINDPEQAAHQSPHGGQQAAEGTNDASDSCEFPRGLYGTFIRPNLLLHVAIVIIIAAVIAVVAGLVAFLTTIDEAHPLSPNSPLERSVTSSRPVSPFPATSAGSTLENNSLTLSPVTIVTEEPTTATDLPPWKIADGVTAPNVSSTDLYLETTSVFPQTGTANAITPTSTTKIYLTVKEDPTNSTILPIWTTADVETSVSPTDSHLETSTSPQAGTTKTVTPATTAKVLTHNVERTRFDQLQKTTKQHPSITHKGECYQSLGCWEDRFDRAIPILEGTDPRLDGIYGARNNPVEKCYQVANSRGFIVFAVQDGGQCFGSADGHNTFFKYGRSSACGVDGKGGSWTNEVYLIGVNVALGKPAFQTSLIHHTSGIASLAVDGNTDTNYDHGSCTHTIDIGETNPSWWVDLGQSYVIDRVLIFNRQDCCSERINPFNIHIGDSDQVSTNPKCGGDHQMNWNQPSISVSCKGMKGRYVGVRLPGSSRILTLCEVQVFLGRCAPMFLDNSAPKPNKISFEQVCRMGDGASYRGTVSKTETGKTCQRWDSQTPHKHYYSTAKFPSSGLEENYCRKTEDWTEVWCFTTDPSTRYEICDVPVCVVGHKRQGCKGGYIRLGLHCIRLVPIQKSFVDAQQACKADGATLAMPKTTELDLALRRLVKTSGGNDEHWIGMTQAGGLDWTWVDGTPLGHYRAWNPGEPRGDKGVVLCVQYWFSGHTSGPMWDDADCSEEKWFICQILPA